MEDVITVLLTFVINAILQVFVLLVKSHSFFEMDFVNALQLLLFQMIRMTVFVLKDFSKTTEFVKKDFGLLNGLKMEFSQEALICLTFKQETSFISV